jgi:hypothetical protein
MSRLKASLNIAPKAVGFTADGDVVISGMGKEKNLVNK